MSKSPLKKTGYYCDLSALDSAQRKRRAELAAEVWPQSREMRELATGYQFRFDFSPSFFSKVAELATLEHLCCPFLELGLNVGTVESRNSFWFKATGDIAAKQFLRAELNL